MKTSVLFVCLGNICRSPAAEGILRHLAEKENISDQINIESCGIGDWHVGQMADERMRDAAKARGVLLTSRAKQFQSEFLEQYDYVLAADYEVLHDLYSYAKNTEQKAKIRLITDFSSSYRGQAIPDPYYQGTNSFDIVLDILEDSCEGLLQHIFRRRKKSS